MEINEEQIYGKEFVQRKTDFLNALSQINKKFSSWYKLRKGVHDSQGHDAIENHYFISYGRNLPKINFGFMPESELPESIRHDCFILFKKYFP